MPFPRGHQQHLGRQREEDALHPLSTGGDAAKQPTPNTILSKTSVILTFQLTCPSENKSGYHRKHLNILYAYVIASFTIPRPRKDPTTFNSE